MKRGVLVIVQLFATLSLSAHAATPQQRENCNLGAEVAEYAAMKAKQGVTMDEASRGVGKVIGRYCKTRACEERALLVSGFAIAEVYKLPAATLRKVTPAQVKEAFRASHCD